MSGKRRKRRKKTKGERWENKEKGKPPGKEGGGVEKNTRLTACVEVTADEL